MSVFNSSKLDASNLNKRIWLKRLDKWGGFYYSHPTEFTWWFLHNFGWIGELSCPNELTIEVIWDKLNHQYEKITNKNEEKKQKKMLLAYGKQ